MSDDILTGRTKVADRPSDFQNILSPTEGGRRAARALAEAALSTLGPSPGVDATGPLPCPIYSSLTPVQRIGQGGEQQLPEFVLVPYRHGWGYLRMRRSRWEELGSPRNFQWVARGAMLLGPIIHDEALVSVDEPVDSTTDEGPSGAGGR